MAAQPQLSASLGVSTADHRGKPLGWKQLRLKGKGKRFRVVSAYDAWARGDINVNVIGGDEAETLNVTAKGVADAWTWQPPGQAGKPSRLVCKRGGQVLAEIGEKDLPPRP